MSALESGCVFDQDRIYRYRLVREPWGEGPPCLFVMLNPSTADETKDDPTVRRCIGYARRWGHGQLAVCNAFALRSTDPFHLYEVADPVGPENNRWIRETAEAVTRAHGRVIAAWGLLGDLGYRDAAIRSLLRPVADLWCLRRSTRTGAPLHPLYLPGALEPIIYSARVLP